VHVTLGYPDLLPQSGLRECRITRFFRWLYAYGKPGGKNWDYAIVFSRKLFI